MAARWSSHAYASSLLGYGRVPVRIRAYLFCIKVPRGIRNHAFLPVMRA
uniref:Uncharacterized protein n=1 Tax=Picea glauca TaxID=3330 RepID=A0A124GNH6_PICGL|nr:hypothetical protein ABT39_MTgene4179 [Picea glauca]QHR91129.1 hypothetical protein Q903MT_gene5161 [Picea sitchensis]